MCMTYEGEYPETLLAQGAIYSQKDVRDYKLICGVSVDDFPKEFQLKYFDDNIVKNQGSVGSCVAHALSTAIEYYNYIQNGVKDEMSTGYIYMEIDTIHFIKVKE